MTYSCFDRAILCIGSQKGIRWDFGIRIGKNTGSHSSLHLEGPESHTNSEETEELTAIQYVQLMRDTLAATTFELDDHAVDTTIEGVPCRVLNLKVRSKVCIYIFTVAVWSLERPLWEM